LLRPDNIGARNDTILILSFVICHLLFIISFILVTRYLLHVTDVYAANVDELVADIEQKAAAISDINGSFSQESFLVDLERTETYTGNFFIKKPSMIRWQYDEPRDEEVYIRTDEIWIYKRNSGQAVRSRFNENAYGQAPIALLASLENLNANFIITATDKEDTLLLKPKRRIGSIKKLLLEISDSDFPVKSFRIFDIYGNNVTIRVNDVATNTGLTDKVFTFTPTPEMEVFNY
jgi:outer membrane lipoprotein carrier protein